MMPTSVVSQNNTVRFENRDDYRWLMDHLPGPAELLDATGKRLYLNSACALFFSRPERMLGTRPVDDPGVRDHSGLSAVIEDALVHGRSGTYKYERTLEDGSHRWLSCQAIVLPQYNSGADSSTVLLLTTPIEQPQHMQQLINEYRMRLKLVQQMGTLGSWEYDFRTETLLMSEGLARIYGLPPQTTSIHRMGMYAMIHPDDRERLFRLRREMEETWAVYEVQYRIIRSDGQTRYLHSRWCFEKDETDRPYRSLGFSEDITDKVMNESVASAATAPDQHFNFLAMNAHDMAIFLLDLNGMVMSWNPGAEKLYGYAPAEILNRHYSVFFVPGEEMKSDIPVRLESANVTGRMELQDWRARKDGDRFLARITITPFYDKTGTHIGYMKLTHELTKQLCVEDILRHQADRLKAHARRLVELQESERQHLARELHDLVGPKLTALGINLQLISSRLSDDANQGISEILRESVNYVHGTVDVLRYIIGELRPHALDDYGLRAALRSHVAQFMRLTGIRVNVIESNVSGKVPDHIKMSLFRITQEALNNVVRHSRATNVDIEIHYAEGNILLVISDNGIGFDQDKLASGTLSQSYGLSIMRERAEAIGASFRVDTASGKGVSIHVECRI